MLNINMGGNKYANYEFKQTVFSLNIVSWWEIRLQRSSLVLQRW